MARLKKYITLNGNSNPKCSKATQLTDLKGAYLRIYFHFLNRRHFLNSYLAAQSFAEHIQVAERIVWGTSLEEVAA